AAPVAAATAAAAAVPVRLAVAVAAAWARAGLGGRAREHVRRARLALVVGDREAPALAEVGAVVAAVAAARDGVAVGAAAAVLLLAGVDQLPHVPALLGADDDVV